jgi:hypothetical protein
VNTRTVRTHKFDRFTSDPPAVDPLADVFEQWSSETVRGQMPVLPLTNTPVVVRLFLNEWLSFRQTGSYRILARTTRVIKSGEELSLTLDSIPLESNAITIEVVAPEPGWAEQQLRAAETVLQRPDPVQPAIGQPFDFQAYERSRDESREAARILRFLETPEAAPALVRYFVKPRMLN